MSEFSPSRSPLPVYGLICILLIALLLRGGMLVTQGHLLEEDRDGYRQIAEHLLAGHGYAWGEPLEATAYRPPLYPLLLAGIFALGGGTLAVGIVQALLGGATVWLVERIGRRLNLGAGSLVAAGLVAVDPLALQNTVLVMTETLSLFLVTLLMWVHLEFRVPAHCRGRGIAASALVGLIYGLCCLCRPTFLVLIPLTAVYWVGREIYAFPAKPDANRKNSRRRETWVSRAVLGIAVLLTLLPWTWRNALLLGKATPATTHGGYTLLLANNPVYYAEVVHGPWRAVWSGESLAAWQEQLELQMQKELPPPADEVARDRWMYARAVENICRQPGSFLLATFERAWRFWDVTPRGNQVSAFPKVIIWGIAGYYIICNISALMAIGSIWKSGCENWLLPLGLVVSLMAVHLFYWTDMRMRAPLIGIVALLATRGIQTLAGRPCRG